MKKSIICLLVLVTVLYGSVFAQPEDTFSHNEFQPFENDLVQNGNEDDSADKMNAIEAAQAKLDALIQRASNGSDPSNEEMIAIAAAQKELDDLQKEFVIMVTQNLQKLGELLAMFKTTTP